MPTPNKDERPMGDQKGNQGSYTDPGGQQKWDQDRNRGGQTGNQPDTGGTGRSDQGQGQNRGGSTPTPTRPEESETDK